MFKLFTMLDVQSDIVQDSAVNVGATPVPESPQIASTLICPSRVLPHLSARIFSLLYAKGDWSERTLDLLSTVPQSG